MSGIILSTDEVNRISRYCAEEVRRQYWHEWDRNAPLRVAGMIAAWMSALEAQYIGTTLNPLLIEAWGAMIEPRNEDGFRKIPIFVGNNQKMSWQLLDRALEGLCASINTFDPPALDVYREFEEIHPFEDGNGRTGKIILNWVNGTLLDPIFPPKDFWGEDTINP